MKLLPLIAFCLATAFLSVSANGQDTNSTSTNSTSDLPSVVQAIQKKIDAGSRSPSDYSNELSQLDALIAAGKSDPNPDVAAHVIYMKAILYLQIFGDLKGGSDLLTKLKDD